jgi:hypothetical protein
MRGHGTEMAESPLPDFAPLHPGYAVARPHTHGRQLILYIGAPERGLASSPTMAKPCFS